MLNQKKKILFIFIIAFHRTSIFFMTTKKFSNIIQIDLGLQFAFKNIQFPSTFNENYGRTEILIKSNATRNHKSRKLVTMTITFSITK